MKKVKITVLKTMFNEDLALEYGVDGLTVCPMLKEGQVFYADTQSQRSYVMRLGKLFINMFLLLHMGQEVMYFTMEIG